MLQTLSNLFPVANCVETQHLKCTRIQCIIIRKSCHVTRYSAGKDVDSERQHVCYKFYQIEKKSENVTNYWLHGCKLDYVIAVTRGCICEFRQCRWKKFSKYLRVGTHFFQGGKHLYLVMREFDSIQELAICFVSYNEKSYCSLCAIVAYCQFRSHTKDVKERNIFLA